MFCPGCGFHDPGESKFCKRCGTNLSVIAQVLASPPSEREDEELALQRRIQEDVLKDALKKRRTLLSVGIIMGCVSVAVMIMLAVMEGPEKGLIGLIPLMVGLGLILSALFVYKPTWSLQQPDRKATEMKPLIGAASPQALPSYPDSVTTETTRQLDAPTPPQRIRE
jgi:hypothetical protein